MRDCAEVSKWFGRPENVFGTDAIACFYPGMPRSSNRREFPARQGFGASVRRNECYVRRIITSLHLTVLNLRNITATLNPRIAFGMIKSSASGLRTLGLRDG